MRTENLWNRMSRVQRVVLGVWALFVLIAVSGGTQ